MGDTKNGTNGLFFIQIRHIGNLLKSRKNNFYLLTAECLTFDNYRLILKAGLRSAGI